jgi:hypothetical protein
MPEAYGTLGGHFSEDAFPDSQLSILIPPSPLGIQGGPKKMYASSVKVARAAGLVGDRTHGIIIFNRHRKKMFSQPEVKLTSLDKSSKVLIRCEV